MSGRPELTGARRPRISPDDLIVVAHTRLGPGREFDLIRQFLAGSRAAGDGGDVLVGPGDDAAVLAGGLVLSTDMSIEGVHFRREWISPFEIGWRSAAGALSDLAAMAARPVGLLTSIATAAGDAKGEAVEVMRGVEACAAAVGGALLGGDLTRSPGPLVLDITVVGMTDRPALRSSGRPGDEIWVTGELGGAAAAVSTLVRGEAPPAGALARFAHPEPRVPQALWLADRGVVRAMIDLSDGLAGDVAHIGTASGARAVLDSRAIPVHAAALRAAGDRQGAVRLAISGGEDYEICFSAAPGSVAPLVPDFESLFGIALTRVGHLDEGEGVESIEEDGSRRRLEIAGYQHFGADD